MLRTYFHFAYVTLFLLSIASESHSQNVDYYRIAPNGAFRNPVLWTPYDPVFPPPILLGPGGETDDAHFNLGFTFFEMYTITDVFGINDQLIIENDAVELEIDGLFELDSPFSSTPGIVVGGSAGDVGIVRFSGVNSELRSVNAYLGFVAGSTGSAIVNGSGLTWENSGWIFVGAFGSGNLSVLNGTVSTNNGVIGFPEGTTCSAAVSGSNSQWINEGFLRVGDFGDGSLEIVNGGIVSCNNADIGRNSIGIGTVTVEGPGSNLTIDTFLDVGCAGEAMLDISDGALVSCGNCATSINAASNSTLAVRGANSELDVSTTFRAGVESPCTLSIEDGGRISSFFVNLHDVTATVEDTDSQLSCHAMVVGDEFGDADFLIRNGANASVTTTLRIADSGGDSDFQLAANGTLDCISIVLAEGDGAGFFSVLTGSTVSCSSLEIWGDGATDVAGTGSLLSVSDCVEIRSDGWLRIRIRGQAEIADELIVYNGGAVYLQGGTLIADSITLQALGTFDFTGGVLHVESFDGDLENDGGTLAPGQSAGITTIHGDYQQNDSARLYIEIGGTLVGGESDFVDVTDDALLDGELVLELIDGYQPTAADSFTILNAGNILGLFDNVVDNQRLDTTDGSGSFLVRYGPTSPNPNQIILSDFRSSLILGDVNGDGVVDFLDIEPFVELLENGEYQAEADINQDGVVDFLDIQLFVDLLD